MTFDHYEFRILGHFASGKSDILATTNGNVSIPGTDLKMGLNLYSPR